MDRHEPAAPPLPVCQPSIRTGIPRARHVAALALAALVAGATGAWADPVDGSWRMVRYEGGGSTGPATGLLLLADGHFSLTYTMEEAGHPLAGRAHAGRYSVDGETLTFHVEWNLERVGGRASAAQQSASRPVRFTLTGDDLTLHFENGAVQQFRRAGPGA